MLKEIPAGMFIEWQSFARLEPFGSEFGEYQSAMIASVVAEVNRNRKKRGKRFQPKDFMQDWTKRPETLDSEEKQIAALEGYMRSMGAAIRTTGEIPELHPKATPKPPQVFDHLGRPIPPSTVWGKKEEEPEG